MAENEQTSNTQGNTSGASAVVGTNLPRPEDQLKEAKTFEEHRAIREKGGVRHRIDQKTREAGEATRAALKAAEAATAAVEELRKGKVQEPPKPQLQPVQTQPAPIVETKPVTFDKPRPKIGDFQDVDAYWSAMADWQIEKRQAEAAKPAEGAKPAAVLDSPEVAALKADLNKTLDNFRVRGNEFHAKHPDFITRLNDAAKRGLDLPQQTQRVIMELDNGPALVYYLSDPANEAKAREIMAMGPIRANIELIRMSEKMTVNPQDYVSRAPAPIPTLRASDNRTDLPLDSKELSFQDYKRLRRQGRRPQ